jgi:hypothetical protein
MNFEYEIGAECIALWYKTTQFPPGLANASKQERNSV